MYCFYFFTKLQMLFSQRNTKQIKMKHNSLRFTVFMDKALHQYTKLLQFYLDF